MKNLAFRVKLLTASTDEPARCRFGVKISGIDLSPPALPLLFDIEAKYHVPI